MSSQPKPFDFNRIVDDRTVDILGRLRARQKRAKDAESRLVDTILADPHFSANATIAEIAARANVSEPTITRLARSIGFSGTRELRYHLTQALAIGGAYLRSPVQSADADAGTSGTISAVISNALAALDLFALGLNNVDIEKIVQPILRARKILIIGTGGSSSMAAVEMHNRLFRLGLSAVTQTDPQLQRMNASVLQEGDVVIGFSISGNPKSVRDAFNIAMQYGAHSIAVTRLESPLARIANALLPLSFQEGADLYRPSSSRYSLLAAVDVLAFQVANQMGARAIENLRRVRQSLATQEILDPSLPIGD